jgi:hypothetical protein
MELEPEVWGGAGAGGVGRVELELEKLDGARAGGAGCILSHRCEDGTGAGGVGWSGSWRSEVELELEVRGVA